MRYMTAGESHGPEEVAIIEGIPAGLTLTQADIDEQLARRQHAYGRGQRQVIETDSNDYGGCSSSGDIRLANCIERS